MTADEIAEKLRLRPRTVHLWAKAGKLPSMKLSPKVRRFCLADVMRAIREEHGDDTSG